MPLLLFKRSPELSLFAQVCAVKNLWKAWKRIQQNGGGPGIDGVTIEAYERQVGRYLEQLRQQLVGGRYRPTAVRRVTIPKASGGIRELGILTVQDRVAQRAVLNVLEETYERLFADCSFGYRPDRSVQLALRRAVRLHRWGYNWLVDGDITAFFDYVRHPLLLRFVQQDLGGEETLLSLIRQWLAVAPAGYRRRWLIGPREALGLVQGSILSPVLSNAYLHRFDQALAVRDIKLVRFADDFLAFAKTQSEAQQALRVIERELKRLGLTLNKEKTRVCHFHDGFTFLGQEFTPSVKFRGTKSCRWCT
jgi:group II intron reverse transcriptase/maturase